jgi:hypothetical protein
MRYPGTSARHEMPAHELIRGVIVIKTKDEERILSFLREYDSEIFDSDEVKFRKKFLVRGD